MQRGFLTAAEATREDVWVSTPAFAHHIGLAHVARKNGLVKVQLRAEDTLRMHPEEEVHRLPPRVEGARCLCMECLAGEQTLKNILDQWTFHDPVTENALTLQPELIDHILGFLAVPRVEMASVFAVACSSIDEQSDRCGLDKVLDPATDNWWISAHNSMEGGKGGEWVAFRLGDPHTSYRVERVDLRIPPLPSGPLSVRDWHLETAAAGEEDEHGGFGTWTRATATLQTVDSEHLQSFHLEPPIEAAFVRIVCTRNAARASADATRAAMARRGLINPEDETEADLELAMSRLSSSIGFFSIAFS